MEDLSNVYASAVETIKDRFSGSVARTLFCHDSLRDIIEANDAGNFPMDQGSRAACLFRLQEIGPACAVYKVHRQGIRRGFKTN